MPQPDYLYKFNNGKTILREDLINVILKTFVGKKKTTMEIVHEIGMKYNSVSNIVRYLCTTGQLVGKRKNRVAYYRKTCDCPLANLFYDKEKILQSFKIKKKIKRTVDQSKNISYPNDSVIKYNNSYMDIMYL